VCIIALIACHRAAAIATTLLTLLSPLSTWLNHRAQIKSYGGSRFSESSAVHLNT
jgi:hypothetical protein